MGLANFSVHKPITIAMLFLGIALLGWVSLTHLPVELMPNVAFGDITIMVNVRGGIPPQEIEERVTKLIEEAVGTVTHLRNILSISKEGEATIILEFEPGTNMDFAALEVRENFARIKNKLPREIERPIIAKYEYLDVPIMILAVTSDERTPEMIRRVVDDFIKEHIERVEGVAKVEVGGGRERKILVEIDQDRLRAHNLSIERVIDILNLNNLNLLAGDIKKAREKYLIRAMGEFESLFEIEQLGIATTPLGSIVRLKDIAEVKDCFLEPREFARLNIKPVVSLYIQKESVANTVRVAEGIQRNLRKIKLNLDEDIGITPTFNQADFIKKAIDTVKTSLTIGAVLAISVIFLFLRDIKSTLIIALTIPLSVLTTFSLMYFRNITLNVVTLSGLALGIGMLVDNAIVVLENIFKKKGEKNESEKKTAVIAGAKEVTLAIVTSTITTIVVFLPIIFVAKEIQLLYGGLALTVTFSLLASLLVALTLVPMLASRLGLVGKTRVKVKNSESPDEQLKTEPFPDVLFKVSFLKNLKCKCKGALSFILLKVSFLENLKRKYKSALSFVLRYRYAFIIAAFVIFIQAFYLSAKLEREFIGIAEQNKFTVFIELPTGTRLEVSDRTVKQVEEILSEVAEIKTYTARVEPWSSKVFVELEPLNKRKRTTGEIIESLRPRVENIQPAFIYFEEAQEVGTKEVILEILGYDYDILKELAISTASRLQMIEGLADVKIRMREGRPEMHLQVDKQRAALFGLTVEDIAGTIHAQMRGLVAMRYHSSIEPLVRLKEEEGGGALGLGVRGREKEELFQKKRRDFRATHMERGEVKEVETIARLQERFRRTFDDVRRLTLITPQGEPVFLEQVAEFNLGLGPSEIWRKNKSRMVQVSASTGGMALGMAARKIREKMRDLEFPRDYFYRFGGNYDKMVENQRQLNFALILTLILVFMALASLFESYLQPLIIMSSVPLAAIGVVCALTLSDKPIGIGVLIGIIMLAGIVVNNAIILVDTVNRLRREKNKSPYQAVIAACEDRLRPILMTTSTTVLGLLPMALDKSEAANLWAPLAIAVIGGLLSSTLMTLFIVPSIYLLFEDIKRKLHRFSR